MAKSATAVQVLLTAFLALVSIGAAQAQDGFGFDVNVDCKDVEFRSLVRGFFSSELRGLGDVRVAEMGSPDYQVDVIAYTVKRNWTMSVVITQPVDADSVDGLSGETAASLKKYSRPIEHSLTQGNSTTALEREIAEIVKTLDDKVLEPRRKG